MVEAVDGESALHAVAEHQPDLVCLDVMMPRLDGIEVCQRLRRQPKHAGLPILLLTALDRPEDKARGLEAGANDFLSKPFDLSELTARCGPCCGRRRCRIGSPTCSDSTSARASRPRCCVTRSRSRWAAIVGA